MKYNNKVIKKVFTFIVLFTLTLSFAGAQELEEINAGLVSDIWFSKTPFFAGEEVKIYTGIWNQSGFDVIGKINFINNGELIGEESFTIRSGELLEKNIFWNVSEGNHRIRAEIVSAKKISTEGESGVSLIINKSDEAKFFADSDIDSDGVGNKEDEDDDGDGISDKEEERAGTNPLVFNEKTNLENASSTNKTKIEEGKDLAKEFVVEPAKEITEKALLESKPIIERIENLLRNKSEELEQKIEEDKKSEVQEKELGFYENIRENLPPVFRILYNWLLRVLILFFSVWWLPLIVFVLVSLRIILGIFRRLRG